VPEQLARQPLQVPAVLLVGLPASEHTHHMRACCWIFMYGFQYLLLQLFITSMCGNTIDIFD
jgi:hypothetical protein